MPIKSINKGFLKNKNLSFISLLLSVICVGITTKINQDIYLDYISSSGKTRALFGLKELLAYQHQYYYALLGILGTVGALH
ncbi:hypothetical protein [Aquimarina rubra]|uniref:ABC transporter ATP-binding protein n=1 Tax=Aquimarina rubra TaxID=1920033 RepID=A0ABW5LBS1_9FLAO